MAWLRCTALLGRKLAQQGIGHTGQQALERRIASGTGADALSRPGSTAAAAL